MLSQNGPTEGSVTASGPVAILADRPARPDPEVPERLERARRRQFTVGYMLRTLTEANAARSTGEIGALLCRERLYASDLAA